MIESSSVPMVATSYSEPVLPLYFENLSSYWSSIHDLRIHALLSGPENSWRLLQNFHSLPLVQIMSLHILPMLQYIS